MIAITEGDSALDLKISGLDMILACKSSVKIPYSQIRAVIARPDNAKQWFPRGFRVGTHLPGFVKKGSWYSTDGSSEFFFVSNNQMTIGIDVEPNEDIAYCKVTVEVPKGGYGP
jgi:hypothetical protein